MNDLASRLARLGRVLRAHGVGTTLRDELDAADALSLVDLEDRGEVRLALRIALKVPRADFDTFERLLAVFWDAGAVETSAPARPWPSPALGRGAALGWDPETRRVGDSPAVADGGSPGYSPRALLRRKRFDEDWTPRDLVAMERILARLARRVATRRSRRLVPTRGRGRADVRASYRRALRTSGELLRIALADGRTVVVSPGHPTASGRLVGELVVGDPLDGSNIEAITAVAYDGFTYDLLPSGPTHTYFADGVLLGSTLAGSR